MGAGEDGERRLLTAKEHRSLLTPALALCGRGGKDLHGAARVGEDSARWGGLRAQGGLLLGVATALGTRIATRSAAACDGSARGRRSVKR